MRPTPPPGSSGEIVLDWLHEEGWKVSHAQGNGEWLVEASKAELQISATGKTLEDAWFQAINRAKRLVQPHTESGEKRRD